MNKKTGWERFRVLPNKITPGYSPTNRPTDDEEPDEGWNDGNDE